MNALGYSIWLQFKLDVRNRNVLSAYYILPLAFYLVIGAIFMKVNPTAKDTFIPSMSVLAISLAAFLGTPAPLVDFFTSDTKKTYKVGNIKLYIILLTTFLSAVAHMVIVSTLIFITAPMIFDINKPTISLEYSGWVLITIAICTVLGMLIGVVAKNNSLMTMISQLIFLPTMLLCGILLPTYILPEILQNIGKILPATYAVEILTSLGNTTPKMIVPLVIIGMFGLAVLIVAYRRVLIE